MLLLLEFLSEVLSGTFSGPEKLEETFLSFCEAASRYKVWVPKISCLILLSVSLINRLLEEDSIE